MELIVLSGGILALPLIAFITSVLFWPGALLKAYNWYWRRRLGLVVRYSHSGSYRFCYCSRGTPGGATPSLLLLHGFSATKDMWLPVINFVQSIGLDKRPFHLVGTSMGGNVAGVYAAQYPAHLSSVTLVCPAGLVYPTDSEFISRLREMEKTQQEDSIPLIPSTPQELEDMLKLCCFTPLNLPKQVLRGLLANRLPNNGFYKEVFMEIVGEKSRHSLQENLHLIKSPVQVIWGKEDQVVDVSGSAVLQAALPSCQVTVLENCGHSVALERPRKAATLIVDFLRKQEVNGENTKKLS